MWGQDTQVTASVGSDTVGVQDQFQLTITVSGKDSGDAENPRVSGIKGFRIVQGPNISSQFQWINGRTSSTKSYIYVLLPEKEGQYTIDPIEVAVGNKVYRTQPLQVRVTSAPRSASPAPQSPINPPDPFEEEFSRNRRTEGNDVFVKAELDRASAFPGQQVTLTYRLYTRVGISGLELRESPSLSGFWVEDIPLDKNPRGVPQTINGRDYQAFIIKKQALFATATGKLKIPSSVFAISARTGGDFFGVFSSTETLYRRTQELNLDVKPLPETGRPPGFSNAVGSFKLTTAIDKKDVATGDAVALHVKLEAQGNLKMIPDISLPALPDFTIYSSKRADSYRTFAGDQLGGDKTWEYVIVPKAPGRQTIPPLSFSFFDAARDKYETVTTPALSLNVVRSSDNAVSLSGLSGADKQDVVRRGADINFIKMSAGELEKEEKPFYQTLWFYLIAIIPLAFNAGAFLYHKKRSMLSGNQQLARSLKAKRRALEQMKTAEKEGTSEARRFYDRAASALSGYLADKFNLTEIQLTADGLDRALSNYGVPKEAVEETRACLQECDFGRFVSASKSTDTMAALSTRIRKNIDELEKIAPPAEIFQNQQTQAGS